MNNPECSVVGVHAERDSVYFNDGTSHMVKRLDVNSMDLSVIAGNGSAGTSGGKASKSSFTQLRAIWGEGQVLYVTDVATGMVRMITPLSGTLKFLKNLGFLFDAFGVHLKGEKPLAVPLLEAIATLTKIVTFADSCSANVQEIMQKNTPTNGPEGTMSSKTQMSTHMIFEGVRRLESSVQDINPAFSPLVNLQSCMTSVVENLHCVTKMKQPMHSHCAGSC